MTLFAELKRRNVLRVAAAYVAVSWLLIQVVETLFPVFGLSDAAIRTVVILLAIGFIPAVISAWAFELTPEGLVRDAEVDRAAPSIKASTKRLDRIVMVALALAVEPDVILLDEPCSALDPIATARIEDLIDELREQFTICIVTHSMQQAARVSQRTAYFHLGDLIEVGETDQIFTNPRHELTEDYITGRFG